MKIILLGLSLTSLLLQAASFEAASIKPSDAAAGSGSGVDTDGPLIRMQNVTLKRFIMSAWGVPEAQILGVPKSMDDLRYDVIARADHLQQTTNAWLCSNRCWPGVFIYRFTMKRKRSPATL